MTCGHRPQLKDLNALWKSHYVQYKKYDFYLPPKTAHSLGSTILNDINLINFVTRNIFVLPCDVFLKILQKNLKQNFNYPQGYNYAILIFSMGNYLGQFHYLSIKIMHYQILRSALNWNCISNWFKLPKIVMVKRRGHGKSIETTLN